MTLPLDGLDLLAAPVNLGAGTPLRLPIDSIDEDPDQPRQHFDPSGLDELAGSIRERGVRQPISVRRHPQEPQRWMLNCGARRLRASKLVGQPDIPAFIDNTADNHDQVIENEQRVGLNPMELALFVQKQVQLGTTSAEIAKRLGKSRGWLTFVGALIDPPDWLMNLYRSGQCRGITELYELRKLHNAHPDAIEAWLADRQQVTRADLQCFKETMKPATVAPTSIANEPGPARVATEAPAVVPAPSTGGASEPLPTPSTARNEAASTRPRDLMLVGTVAGTPVRVLLNATRAGDDEVFVIDLGSAQRRVVAIASIGCLRLVVGLTGKRVDQLGPYSAL
jgi:ParB family transcriptional regulator, chromosome partitioning protein